MNLYFRSACQNRSASGQGFFCLQICQGQGLTLNRKGSYAWSSSGRLSRVDLYTVCNGSEVFFLHTDFYLNYQLLLLKEPCRCLSRPFLNYDDVTGIVCEPTVNLLRSSNRLSGIGNLNWCFLPRSPHTYQRLDSLLYFANPVQNDHFLLSKIFPINFGLDQSIKFFYRRLTFNPFFF